MDSDGSGDTGTGGDDRCRECGASLNRYAMFCSECGTKRADDSGDQQDGQHGRGRARERRRERAPPDRQQSRGANRNRGASADRRQDDRADGRVAADPESDTGMAALAHVAALFLGVIGSGLVYVVADDPFVRRNAANATNWQIMLIVYAIVSMFLVFFIFGIFLLFALIIANFAFIIIAAIKASNGEAWEYPLTPEIL